jgi:hypothetical protein
MRSSTVTRRFGMSHSTADGIDGGPNSIVAEIPDAVVSAESSGFSPASAVPEDEAVESAQKKLLLRRP